MVATRASPNTPEHVTSLLPIGGPRRLLRALRAHAAMHRVQELTVAHAHGLPWLQTRCLAEFADESELTIKQLTQRLGLSHSRLSHVLDWLEKRELVARRINLEDRRIIIVQITPRGSAIVEALEARLERCYERALRDQPPEACETAVALLAHTIDVMREASEESLRRHT
jgi:DNA-binding MarR family transcriptional regulator